MSNLHLIIARLDEDCRKLDAHLATKKEGMRKMGEGVYLLVSNAHPEQVYHQVCKDIKVSGKIWISKIGIAEEFGSETGQS